MDLIKKRKRIRYKLKSVSTLPRLSVHKTNKYFYAQIIDLSNGNVIFGASTKKYKNENKEENYYKSFGVFIGNKLKDKKVEKICFDRGGYIYHGRIKEFADGVRSTGIQF